LLYQVILSSGFGYNKTDSDETLQIQVTLEDVITILQRRHYH